MGTPPRASAGIRRRCAMRSATCPASACRPRTGQPARIQDLLPLRSGRGADPGPDPAPASASSACPPRCCFPTNRWLDVIPIRSGKGQAIRYVAMRWGLPADKVLVYARRGSRLRGPLRPVSRACSPATTRRNSSRRATCPAFTSPNDPISPACSRGSAPTSFDSVDPDPRKRRRHGARRRRITTRSSPPISPPPTTEQD